jgi:hypothetical protein
MWPYFVLAALWVSILFGLLFTRVWYWKNMYLADEEYIEELDRILDRLLT